MTTASQMRPFEGRNRPDRQKLFRPAGLQVLLACAVVLAAGMSAIARDDAGLSFPERTAVPQLPCHPDDRPETGLQGRVPREDLASGRAGQGYSCNLEVVGHFPTPAWASFDTYEDCAYVAREVGAGGVVVLDVSDPRNPVPTDTLTTPAMIDPWESMRVNAKRGLLVADGELRSALDVYDVSDDCRHPELLSSTALGPPVKGHEGWFSPDGSTYYMSTTRGVGGNGISALRDHGPTLFPVDLKDPTQPQVMSSWAFQAQTHGGSTTEDGTRSYVCQQSTPPQDALLVVDTSDVAARETSPQPDLQAQIPLEDNQWCQGAYRVTYDGHPYLIQYGERSGAADCSRAEDNWANFGYPRFFDLADETRPRLVGSALLEVHLPEHCESVTGEGAVNGLGYSVHHCSPDRLYNPTILACSWFHAGLRVLDIRDPHHPVEIGYFNPGINGPVGTVARPVIRSEREEIWFTNDAGGFYVLKFRDGTWPFPKAEKCPEFDDYYFAHYNPESSCPTANFNGLGKPAPAAPRYRSGTGAGR
jgi:hypothetical protein